MMKFITMAALAVLLVGTAKADDITQFQNEAIDPVVQLNRNCSAVVLDLSNKEYKVDPKVTYLATADHCVEKQESTTITIDTKDRAKLIGTQEIVADVIQHSSEKDLAVLKVRRENVGLKGAIIAETEPTEGERVYTIGYPLGLTRTVTEGFFGGFMSFDKKMDFDSYGNGREVYRATPAIYGGNSGGGLFWKQGERWKLLGISDAGFPAFFVAGFYNTQKDLNKLVDMAVKSDIDRSEKETKEASKAIKTDLNGWATNGVRQ